MSHRMTCLLAILLLINTVATQTGSITTPGEQRPQVRGELPEGWNAPGPGAGAVASAYEVGVDRTVKHGGEASAYIRAVAVPAEGFMALVQGSRGEQYRGKRLRLSGYIRTREVADRAGLWVQILGGGGSVGFDNMQNRPVKGTSDWTKYEIVLDVPMSTLAITFGFLLRGSGQAWVDDFSFEVVGQDVSVTNMAEVNRTNPANVDAQTRASADVPTQPTNLDFERLNR